MRTYLPALFLILSSGGCKKKEILIDTEVRFSPLDSGAEFSLRDIPQDVRKLIVNFYAPDCPPCEKEIGALKKFYEKYRANSSVGFVAVGSSLKAVAQNPASGKDPSPSREEIKKDLVEFRRKFSIAYPQFVAESGMLAAWRITGFPETFVFIRRSDRLELVRKIVSEVTLETLEEEIRRN